MVERYKIQFEAPVAPDEGRGSKFGGQPHWIDAPAWPVARTLGEPMRFLAQFELPPPLCVGGHKMAYLFLADHDPARGNMPYEYDCGDNAVILQGGAGYRPDVQTIPVARGPTLRRGRRHFGAQMQDDPASPDVQVPVRLKAVSEPAPLSELDLKDLWVEDRDAYHAYSAAMLPSKVGGNPLWLQGPDTPLGGPWKLLAQVDIEHVPCWAPFDGWLYAFVAADGSGGRMLYQIT